MKGSFGHSNRVDVIGKVAFWCVAVAASFFFVREYFAVNVQYVDQGSFAALVEGTAATPYQYRALIPWLVRGLSSIPWLTGITLIQWFQGIAFVSLVLCVAAFQSYLAPFFHNRNLTRLLSLSLFYVLLWHFILPREYPFLYPADFPAILFFTLGLILLYRRDWRLYYPLFVLATLNRETSCFLIVVYLCTAMGRTSWRSLALHTVAQASLWLAVKVGLYALYHDNAGVGLFADQLLTNLYQLGDLGNWATLASLWGFTWVPVLLGFRRIQEPFVRRSLLALIPFLLGMGFVGVAFELRIYGEVIPLVLASFWLVVKGWFAPGRRQMPAATQRFVMAASWRFRGGLLALTGLLVLVPATAYLYEGVQASSAVHSLQRPLDASLAASLASAGPEASVVVVNWPRLLEAPAPRLFWGFLPQTPAPARIELPARSSGNVRFLQYRPWQSDGNGVKVSFEGTEVTQAEMVAALGRADVIVDFDPVTTRMYTLAEKVPAFAAQGCLATFAEKVCLVEGNLFRDGQTLRLDLAWRFLSSPSPDTAIFVHLLSDGGGLVGQADGAPARNSLALADWPASDTVLRETRLLAESSTASRVSIGVYDRASGQRLPAVCVAGASCESNGLILNATARQQ